MSVGYADSIDRKAPSRSESKTLSRGPDRHSSAFSRYLLLNQIVFADGHSEDRGKPNLKILVVAIPVVFVGNDLGFLLSEPLGGQRDDRELP